MISTPAMVAAGPAKAIGPGTISAGPAAVVIAAARIRGHYVLGVAERQP